MQPRFYFFDRGVKRQLDGTLGIELRPSTGAFGNEFEAWLIHEIVRTCAYRELDYQFSFYRSKHGAEIDLILKRGLRVSFIEIKSTEKIDVPEVRAVSKLVEDFSGEKTVFYVSRDPSLARIDGVECLPYWEFLEQLS